MSWLAAVWSSPGSLLDLRGVSVNPACNSVNRLGKVVVGASNAAWWWDRLITATCCDLGRRVTRLEVIYIVGE